MLLWLILGILAAGDYERVYRRGVSKGTLDLAYLRAATAARRAREAQEQYDAEHGGSEPPKPI